MSRTPLRDCRLTGRGGVALVCFHLARRGHYYQETTTNSPLGDIWVHIGMRKIGIEVKTSKAGVDWIVRNHQIEAVDWYCFVSLRSGSCWVVPSDEVAAIANRKTSYQGIVLVSLVDFPKDAFEAWQDLDGLPPDRKRLQIVTKPRLEDRAPLGKPKIIRRQLADGSIKEYRYPGRRIKPKIHGTRPALNGD